MKEFTKSERAYNFSYSNEAINKGNLKLLDKLLNISTKATMLLNSNKENLYFAKELKINYCKFEIQSDV